MLDRTTIKTIVDNEPAKNSAGYFIELMTSFNRYISEEYKQNRLTGAQYAEVYLGGMQANLQAAIDYAKHQDAQNLQEQLAQEQLAEQKRAFDAQLAKQDEWKIAELDLQQQKLDLERELNVTQQALIRSQTQAFKAKHNKEMAKLVFDVVTIGVTQEQMNILAGPNPIFGSLQPAQEYAKAVWVDTP